MEKKKIQIALLSAVVLFFGLVASSETEAGNFNRFATLDVSEGCQTSDPDFDPSVADPAYYIGTGPILVIDEAHFNFYTKNGRFAPFANVLMRDGYQVESSIGRYTEFTHAGLYGINTLVIANALDCDNQYDDTTCSTANWKLPAPSAFTEAEIDALKSWVSGGGNLMLLADHFPFANAAMSLAEAFGFSLASGYTYPTYPDPSLFPYGIEFNTNDSSLRSGKIVNGRNASEVVPYVTSFVGHTFWMLPSSNAQPLMVFSGNQGPATLFVKATSDLDDDSGPYNTPYILSQGLLQGATLEYGAGKVAFFGEAGMFSAQISSQRCDPGDTCGDGTTCPPSPNNFCYTKVGMNNPIAPHNKQFLLNTMHWLDGMLETSKLSFIPILLLQQ